LVTLKTLPPCVTRSDPTIRGCNSILIDCSGSQESQRARCRDPQQVLAKSAHFFFVLVELSAAPMIHMESECRPNFFLVLVFIFG
jgi:hypothetical protein